MPRGVTSQPSPAPRTGQIYFIPQTGTARKRGYGTTGLRDYGMEATEGTEGTEGTAGGGGRSDCGRLSAWGQIRHAAEKQKERLGGCGSFNKQATPNGVT